jgi:hypothetical protein
VQNAFLINLLENQTGNQPKKYLEAKKLTKQESNVFLKFPNHRQKILANKLHHFCGPPLYSILYYILAKIMKII